MLLGSEDWTWGDGLRDPDHCSGQPKLLWLLIAGLGVYGAWGLLQPRSEIRVISEPIGAQVVIDGSFALEAPAVQHLRLGSHIVVLRAPGYEPEELTVALGMEPVLVQAKLLRRRPPWNGANDQSNDAE